MKNQKEVMIRMAIDLWNTQIKKADYLLQALTDEQFQLEIAPNRNRGIYILGHLAAIHDKMLTALSGSVQMYPELEEEFIKNPDKAITNGAPLKTVKKYWRNIEEALAVYLESLSADEWMHKHSEVPEDEDGLNPSRNRLNVLFGRTNHLSYHLGQLSLLINK